MNIAIVPAAGKSRRMKKNKNKVFLNLHGRPILYYSLRALNASAYIDQIIVLLGSEREIKKLKKELAGWRLPKVIALIRGGRTRQETVFKGLKFLDCAGVKKNDIIIVHNGANPFVTKQEIKNSIALTRKFGASLVARKSTATVKYIKRANGQLFVKQTVDRNRVWLAETPQTFSFAAGYRAYRKADKRKIRATDDAYLLEQAGIKVAVVEAAPDNIKITRPEDLTKAEIIIKRK